MESRPGYETINNTQSDEELVERIQAGDTAAFDLIVDRYKNRVYSYALRMLRNPETANEVSQDIFLRAYRYLDRFRGDAKFSTWFYTIVSSTCKNAASYHGLREKHRENTAHAADGEDRQDIFDRISDRQTATEHVAERREKITAVRAAIEQLPELYRQVVVLKDINDVPYEEISQILDCRLGTVKSRLSRARIMLREQLMETGMFEPGSDLR